MYGNTKILGIIPARGGSKGIPHKNIYLLNGNPLISYTILSSLKSKRLSRVIVSTDSYKIAEVSRKYGADIPFMRPAELATDDALAIDVIKHALQEMETIDRVRYDYVVMLQPTTPLKKADDIDQVVDKLINTGCDTVVSMVDVGANHPARMYTIEKDRLVSVIEEGITMRPRQELPHIYIRNGAVYACHRDVIFDHNTLIGPDCRPFVMPTERSVNIDDISDVYLAEYYLKQSPK